MKGKQLMSREQYHQNILDMLYLSVCALHGIAPEQSRVTGMDRKSLYAICKFHSMTAITAMGLEAAGVLTSGTEVQAWKEAMAKSIRKNLMLDAERQKLSAFLDEHGIWYMPLKGSILKDLYPRTGMRQMADNDILYDSQYQDAVKKYMVSQGYQAVSVGRGNHDVYEKPPIYNYELHTALFGAAHDETWCAYYENVKDRLVRNGEHTCGYHFSDEDFYLYMMVHACKHHKGGGTGLRSLMDCYVYVWKKGESLDWEYIKTEAGKLGISEFEQGCRNLSRKLFSDPEHIYKLQLSGAEQELFADFVGSGTYGTTENMVKKKLHAMQPEQTEIQKQTKARYLLRRIVPDRKWFQQYYPFCDRHPWVIPFFCVFRIVRVVLWRSGKIKAELSAVRDVK